MKKLAIIIVLLLAAALAVVFWASRSAGLGGRTRLREFRVEQRAIGETITESGTLVSMETTPVRVLASGEILEITKTGTRVTEGDVVLRVDDTKTRDRLKELEEDIRSAQTDRASADADYEYAVLDEDNDLTLLHKKLSHGQLELAQAEQGLTADDRRLLEIELETAKLDLLDADDELARQKRLFAKGFISEAMLEPYQRKAEAGRASVDEIEARIRLEEKGVPAEQLLELEKTVERYRAMVARAEKAKERRLELIRQAATMSDLRIAKAEYSKGNIEKELGDTETVTTRSGVMSVRLRPNWRHGGGWTEYKPGIEIWKYDSVADIVDLGKMKVEIMIHESDIERVREGMVARIRLSAFPDREFSGKIIELGGVGRDRAEVARAGFETDQTGVAMFNAAVSIEGEGVEFRPGMSAVVELTVREPVPTLVLPREAVRGHEGTFTVTRRTAAGSERVTVKAHVLSDRYVAIEDGLDEGDIVVGPREDEP